MIRQGTAIFLCFLAIWAGGQSSNFFQNKQARVKLISAYRKINVTQPFLVAVRFKLTKGWHTYWKNPGDSGFPVKFKWKLPAGFQAQALEWPVPMVFNSSAGKSYGYADEVFFLTRIIPVGQKNQKTSPSHINIKLKLNWLVCKDICLPGQADLTLNIPVTKGKAVPGQTFQQIIKQKQHLPGKLADLKHWQVQALVKNSNAGKNKNLIIRLSSSQPDFTPQISGLFPLQGTYFAEGNKWQILKQQAGLIVLAASLNPHIEKYPGHWHGLLVSRNGWQANARPRAVFFKIKASKKITQIKE
jgi:thiol:disulfide interchange protein DsbD